MSTTEERATTDPGTETRRLRVFRFTRGDEASHLDVYDDVPVGPRTTVLDALRWVQIHRDGSLNLRHSCFHASCGTCGLRVNGREVLGCVTSVQDLGPVVTVEPVANIPVLSDLVVDMAEFYARFPDEIGTTRTSEFLPEADPPASIDHFERYEDCIECGLCLSACPVSATSDEYVGPAALAAGQRLLEEPRGAPVDRILDWADDPVGAWRCHATFECTEACPAGVNPAARIMALRGMLVNGRLERVDRKETS
ncbi:MAG: succinate dehydrogenase/fumarate reductase iron-sulfur subunit [Actinomycetota bacterium]